MFELMRIFFFVFEILVYSAKTMLCRQKLGIRYIAIDASTTHLYLPGLKPHGTVLSLGATRDEIMVVLELTSVLGIHTCTLGFQF